jgi:hypothetical protein
VALQGLLRHHPLSRTAHGKNPDVRRKSNQVSQLCSMVVFRCTKPKHSANRKEHFLSPSWLLGVLPPSSSSPLGCGPPTRAPRASRDFILFVLTLLLCVDTSSCPLPYPSDVPTSVVRAVVVVQVHAHSCAVHPPSSAMLAAVCAQHGATRSVDNVFGGAWRSWCWPRIGVGLARLGWVCADLMTVERAGEAAACVCV